MAGIVKINHHRPTAKRTRRREKVVDPVATTIRMESVCRVTAPKYPMPIAYDDTFVDSCSCCEDAAGDDGYAASSIVDGSRDVDSTACSGPLDSVDDRPSCRQ